MIIYSDSRTNFTMDLVEGQLEKKLLTNLATHLGIGASKNEITSWRNSLAVMGNVINASTIPPGANISIEYNIPYTSKRVDMIISGISGDGRKVAVIIELKQWTHVEKVEGKEAIVRTMLGGSMKETVHPSYQAWSYAEAIMDFNEDVRNSDVLLKPCAYLHNYSDSDPDPLDDPVYRYYVDLAPFFSREDGRKLVELLNRNICGEDGNETIRLIEEGRLKPSKSLQDCIVGMMEGNREFILMDEQRVAYEEVVSIAKRLLRDGRKRTIIIRGGPGTGKTVIAVNLLSKLLQMDLAVQYVSKNQAPRSVYGVKLKGGKKRSKVDKLFVGPGRFADVEKNTYDVLLTDESHRLVERDQYSKNGKNQVLEIINASRLSVFFIDEDQRITSKDIGTIKEIERCAQELGSAVSHILLESQFRCSGSNGYLEWLDGALDIRHTLDFDGSRDFDYDFRVFDDPNELRDAIIERNSINNRSRMVAGYCWNWDKGTRSNPDHPDVIIPEFGFRMSWNLDNTTTWAIDEMSVNELGCVHTCQGLEFDYIGVIIGDDMRFEDGRVITDPSKKPRTDVSLHGLKTWYPNEADYRREAGRIIKNTYKVLMTRGMKGCYVFCTDKNLAQHLREGFPDSAE